VRVFVDEYQVYRGRWVQLALVEKAGTGLSSVVRSRSISVPPRMIAFAARINEPVDHHPVGGA
jgi:hypothetical protein